MDFELLSKEKSGVYIYKEFLSIVKKKGLSVGKEKYSMHLKIF